MSDEETPPLPAGEAPLPPAVEDDASPSALNPSNSQPPANMEPPEPPTRGRTAAVSKKKRKKKKQGGGDEESEGTPLTGPAPAEKPSRCSLRPITRHYHDAECRCFDSADEDQTHICCCCVCCAIATNRSRMLEILLLVVFGSVAVLSCSYYGIYTFLSNSISRGYIAPKLVLLLLVAILPIHLAHIARLRKYRCNATQFRRVAFATYCACLLVFLVPLLQIQGAAKDLEEYAGGVGGGVMRPAAFSMKKWLSPLPAPAPSSFTAQATWLPKGDWEVTTETFKTVNSRNVSTCTSMSRAWKPQLELDVWRPPAPSGALVFHVHGGAWQVGDKSTATWLGSALEMGATVVSSQYVECHTTERKRNLPALTQPRPPGTHSTAMASPWPTCRPTWRLRTPTLPRVPATGALTWPARPPWASRPAATS